jgi:cellulose synthase (UDP-forming)
MAATADQLTLPAPVRTPNPPAAVDTDAAPAMGAPLPSPPSDAERGSYFSRRLGLLTAFSLASVATVTGSTVLFALAHSAFTPYLVVVAFTVVYLLISQRVNAFSRDASLEDHRARVASWSPARVPSVDVMLPICGEATTLPHNTWSYVAGLRWAGELTVIVLDDGPENPVVEAMAQEFGFRYLRRPDRGWMKKAGNLRYGYERSNGDFMVIFDADFCPRRDFLAELMPYFDDERTGIVQSPQYFRTLAAQGWLERGAGAVQEFFYRAIQTSRQARGGAICVGTNAIYRRAALDANGGTTLIGHSEDVHTGFDLRRAGWDLRYVPAVVATGVCPDDLTAFFRQQYRWCMGSMSLLGSRKFWATPMPVVSRLCYLSGFGYYLHTAFMSLLTPVIPLSLLVFWPDVVRVENYALLAPALLYTYVLFPAWHRSRYGLAAFSVRLVYGWAHFFALCDIVRRRPMGWTPTGARQRKDRRMLVLRLVAGGWSAGAATACVALAGVHAAARPLDFAPLIVLQAVQVVVAGRVFTSTAAGAKVAADTPARALQPAPLLSTSARSEIAEVAA